MNASAEQRNLRTFKEASAMKRRLFRVFLNFTSELNNYYSLKFIFIQQKFVNYWNGEHAEQGITHLNEHFIQ